MRSRPYTTQDYPALSVWWQLHSWPSVPEACLPTKGLVVEDLNQRICAGFVYNTDSSIAWIEFIVANPLCDKLIRDKALDLLLIELIDLAKGLGKSVIFTSARHPALIERYKKHGATVGDEGMTNLVWRI